MIITTIIIIIRSRSPWLKLIRSIAVAMELAPCVHSSSAAQPAELGPTHKLAFYNVGWLVKSKKHNQQWLSREVTEIVRNKSVHALGISDFSDKKMNI